MIARTWSFILMAAVCAINICNTVESAYVADEILHLPGQSPVNFRQFAGYINIDKEQQRSLFYYFVEAETDPASKPLVLWLGGGQCSSIALGAFGAHGPFRPSGKNLVKNIYSWNREANMLYFDYPGVGFSSSLNKSFATSVNDKIIAQDSLVFLQNWFDKFTEYKSRDFFIAGTNLAGYFVPRLAQLIVHSNMKCNLKAIALGNPRLDVVFEMNLRAEFLWSHGIISDALFESFTNVCNISQLYLYNSNTPACSRVRSEDKSRWPGFGILSDTCISSGSKAQPQYSSGGRGKTDACLRDEIIQYMSREDVQNAFHPQLVGVANWSICNFHVNPFRGDEETPRTMAVGLLVKAGIRAMVYSGDQEALFPLTATRKLINKLAEDMKMNTTVSYRAWFESGQVGGWTQVYDDMLTFATIRGASSNPALTQPERSLVLFTSFLSGKPLPDFKTSST